MIKRFLNLRQLQLSIIIYSNLESLHGRLPLIISAIQDSKYLMSHTQLHYFPVQFPIWYTLHFANNEKSTGHTVCQTTFFLFWWLRLVWVGRTSSYLICFRDGVVIGWWDSFTFHMRMLYMVQYGWNGKILTFESWPVNLASKVEQ